MTFQEILKNISERVQTTASVKVVYGEPIHAEGKTIIPVASIRYGFGGGGGNQMSVTGAKDVDESLQHSGGGGGGGGGVAVSPVGFIEITAGETRYVSFDERRRMVRAIVVGLLLSIFLLRRRRRA